MTGIIDYRMGNLRSVQKAFEKLGAEASILSAAEQVEDVDRLVLPGVGAFADGMGNLDTLGFVAAIRDFIGRGRPFLGICLGMELLFDGSDEDAPNGGPPIPGLRMVPGAVVRFEGESFGPGKLKVPHMGWNTIRWERDDPLLAGLEQDCAVYFVHSYYTVPEQGAQVVSAVADYSGWFCASLWRDNIWATQFHPEKSQHVGLKMLANFLVV